MRNDPRKLRQALAASRYKLARLFIVWTGISVAMLGLIVVVGWHLHIPTLIQILPTYAPMQYNTALSFLLCGLGLLSLTREWRHWGSICSIVVMGIGVLTLCQYTFGTNFHIDQLLMRHEIQIHTSHPGRMGPNTAASFILMGIALGIMSRPVQRAACLLTTGVCGMLIFAIGVIALVGYLTGLQSAYGWGRFSDMALHTAAGFTVLGSGTLISTWHKGRAQETGALQWVSVLLGLGVLTLTILLWQALLSQEYQRVFWSTLVQTASIRDEITARLQSRLQLLVSIAERWTFQGEPSEAEWDFDTRFYLDYYPDSHALAWIDTTLHLRRITTAEEAGASLVYPLAASEAWPQVLKKAGDSQRPVAIAPFLEQNKGFYFQVIAPFFRDELLRGYILVIFHVQSLLDMAFENVALNYAIALFHDGHEIYGRYNLQEQDKRLWSRHTTLDVYGVSWHIQVWPRAKPLAENVSLLPEVVLIGGMVLSVFLMLTVNFGQTARFHARRLTVSNTGLQGEILERRRAEEALQVSQQFLQSTLDALSANIAIVDASGTITAVNKAWKHFANYHGLAGPSYGIGINYLAICDATTGPEAMAAQEVARGIRQVITGEIPAFHFEYPCHTPISESWFIVHVTHFENTQGIYAVIAHEDISPLRRAEAAMQRQREALYQNEKLAAMGSLLSGIAHELNNPLALVMMQADLLREEVQDSALSDIAEKLSEAAQRCTRIVRNFLMLARQHPPERTRVQLNTLIRDTVEMLAYGLQIDNITLHLQLDEELPALWADAHQLQQVLVNLLTNGQQALQEIEPPRHLTLTTTTDPTRTKAFLSIQDNGPGISAELQQRIFEPFFTTKPAGVGTGLGLSLCRSILESHGGTLTVHSQAGEGTEFRLDIPVGMAPLLVRERPETVSMAPAHNKTILVVDDESGIANALAYLLRRDGHQVDIASNGAIALERLHARQYDLILSDLRMPELDGPRLYEELEHHYPHLRQRLIFLTGDTLNPETRRFLEQVGVPCLTKPFTSAEARSIVRQALQGLD